MQTPKTKREQLLCVYIGPKQRICRIYKAAEHVLLNDFQARGQSAGTQPVSDDIEQMQRPGTASKHTAYTAVVDPVAVAEENGPDVLGRLCQQQHTSAQAHPRRCYCPDRECKSQNGLKVQNALFEARLWRSPCIETLSDAL